MPKKPKKNQDIIDFRYKLIDAFAGDTYYMGVLCNDGVTNVMTPEKKQVLNDVLAMFNVHFGLRDYELG